MPRGQVLLVPPPCIDLGQLGLMSTRTEQLPGALVLGRPRDFSLSRIDVGVKYFILRSISRVARLKVMIADDEPMIRMYMRDIVEEARYLAAETTPTTP